jgi:hypothetical protein
VRVRGAGARGDAEVIFVVIVDVTTLPHATRTLLLLLLLL